MSNKNETPYIFISYSRDQKDTALALKKMLESYKYPHQLITDSSKTPPHAKYLRQTFVDVTDLEVKTESYFETLEQELKNAHYLIVLCSKSSARDASVCHWEITTFLKYHSEDKVLPVVLDGFAAGDDGLAVIPKEVQNIVDKRNVPVWGKTATANSTFNRSAFFHIVEFILGVKASALHDRHAEEQKKQIIRIGSVIIIILATIISLLSYGLHKQKQLAITETQRVDFERRVFPFSIVTNYHNNFILKLERYVTGKVELDPSVTPSPTAKRAVLFVKLPDEKQPDTYQKLIEKDEKRISEVFTPLHDKYQWEKRTALYKAPKDSRSTDITELLPPTAIKDTLFFMDAASTIRSIKEVVDILTVPENPFYTVANQCELSDSFLINFKRILNELHQKHQSKNNNQTALQVILINSEEDIINCYNRLLQEANSHPDSE